jgi:hypothetical protein
MAAINFQRSRHFSNIKTFLSLPNLQQQLRSVVTTQREYVLNKPTKLRFGFVRVAVVVLTGAWVGSTIGQTVARYLRENDIYVPSDDDE